MTEALVEPIPPEVAGLRSLLGDSAIYGLSVAALPIALILATPFVARALGPEDFGAVDVLVTLVSLLGLVATAGMDSAVGRSYFDYADEDLLRRRTVVRTAVVIVLSISTVGALIAGVAGFVLTRTAETSVTAAAVVVAVALMPLTNSQLLARSAFLLQRRRVAYLVAGILNAALGAIAAVVLVVLGLGPTGYFLGLAVGSGGALAFSLAASDLLERASWFDRREAAVMLRFGMPLVPAAAAAWMIFALDRTLIAVMKGLDDAGQYGLAAKVTAPMLLVATAFAIAWGPFIMREPLERRRELRARVLPAAAAAAGIVFLWLVLFADQLVDALGGAGFESADRAVPGLALGWLAWTVAIVLQTELGMARRTGVIALVTSCAAAANVILNLLLIPPFGFVGAAWATAAAFGLLAVAYAAIEPQLAPVRHDVRALAGVAAVLAGASSALLAESLTVRALAAAIGTLVLTVLLRRRDRRRLESPTPGPS
jgi:O-antigen/teichoic acid export membrane protein